jgi:hypothetical protein
MYSITAYCINSSTVKLPVRLFFFFGERVVERGRGYSQMRRLETERKSRGPAGPGERLVFSGPSYVAAVCRGV